MTSEQTVIELASRPTGWWAVAAVTVMVVICWYVRRLYRWEGRSGAPERVRLIMTCLRCAVLVLLGLIWLEPVAVRYLHRTTEAYTVVLVDDSASMDLVDRDLSEPATPGRVGETAENPAGPVRRIDRVRDFLLAGESAFLSKLAEHNTVQLYSFASGSQLVATVPSPRLRPHGQDAEVESSSSRLGHAIQSSLAALGGSTNISRSLQQAVGAAGSSPIAGVILFSDGRITAGEPAATAAEFTRRHRIPLYAVGVGDDRPIVNVRVFGATAPTTGLAGDPLSVSVTIEAQGMDSSKLEAILYEEFAEDGALGTNVERIVERRPINFESPIASPADPPKADHAAALVDKPPVAPGAVRIRRRRTTELSFALSRDRPGTYHFRVHVPPSAEEIITSDNDAVVSVRVLDGALRVLLVAGGPSRDYRYLSRLLMRDQTIDVSCWLQSADVDAVRDGDTIIDHLPTTTEELFQYHAVVLLDPDPRRLTPSFASLVGRFVIEQGGGVIYVAGRPFAAMFFRSALTRPLVSVLPVVPDPEAELVLNDLGHYQTTAFAVAIPDEARHHPVLRRGDGVGRALPDSNHVADALLLSGGARPTSPSALGWGGVGGVYWHFPVLHEKPAASVLMRHTHPQMGNRFGAHILLAVQYAGAGRSAMLTFDGTWRWREHGEDLYNQFWVQMLRHLAEGRLAAGGGRISLTTDADRYALGDEIHIAARLLDVAYKPVDYTEVSAEVRWRGETETVTLTPAGRAPGWFEGRFTPAEPGRYAFRMVAPSAVGPASEPTEVATRYVSVVRPDLEMVDPRMDRTALRTLAELSDGGRYFELATADEIVDLIPDRHESTRTRSTVMPLWDRGWVLMMLLGLLCLEWSLRRWYRLL